jgi:outer membrane protein
MSLRPHLTLILAAIIAPSFAVAGDLLTTYRQALSGDPELRAAVAGHRAALTSRDQTRSALLPRLTLGGEAGYTKSDTTPGGSSSFSDYGLNLSLNQVIYRHENYIRLRQTDGRIAQADAQLSAAESSLVLRVARAWFDLLAAHDSLAFAEAERRAVEQQLRQVKQRFDVGLSAITDVHEAQAAYDATLAQEIVARNTLAINKETLRAITGNEPPENPASLADDLPLLPPDPADIEQWVTAALGNNLQLRAAQAGERIARDELNRREATRYPSVDLIASLNHFDRSNAPNGSEGDQLTIKIQASVPLYTGGLTTAQTTEARALLNQSSEALEQQQRSVIRDTRSAYLNVSAGIGSVQARRQALSSARTAVAATQAGYEVGTRTAVDVLNSQREQFRAERDYARARYDYLIATLALRQAAGSLNESDIIAINQWLRPAASQP